MEHVNREKIFITLSQLQQLQYERIRSFLPHDIWSLMPYLRLIMLNLSKWLWLPRLVLIFCRCDTSSCHVILSQLRRLCSLQKKALSQCKSYKVIWRLISLSHITGLCRPVLSQTLPNAECVIHLSSCTGVD